MRGSFKPGSIRNDISTPGAILRCLGLLFCVLLAAVVSPFSAGAEQAAENVKIDVQELDGHGRLILTFPNRMLLPEYASKVANGVLTVQFTNPVNARLDAVAITLARYVSVARQDADLLGMRFALTRGVKVNTMEAGAQLFVDFLPMTWQGLPPPLPPEIVAALARKAEEAIRKAREAEQRNGGRTIPPLVDFRVGENPTFTRFSFGWNVPFDTQFSREAESVKVTFNRVGEIDLSDVKVHLPPLVDGIDTQVDAGKMSVIIRVKPAADVRAFRDGDSYVVDVVNPVGAPVNHAGSVVNRVIQGDRPAGVNGLSEANGTSPAPSEAVQPAETAQVPPAPLAKPAEAPAPAAAMAGQGETGSPDQAPPPAGQPPSLQSRPGPSLAAASLPAEAPVATPAAQPSPKPALPPAPNLAANPAVPGEGAATNPSPYAMPPLPKIPAAPGQPATATMAENGPAREKGAQGKAVSADLTVGPSLTRPTTLADVGAAEQASGKKPVVDPFIRVVGEKAGSVTRLVFPFPNRTRAAVFQRGSALWMVFDDPSPYEISEIRNVLVNVSSAIDDVTGKDFRAVRVDLLKPLFASVSADGNNWVVTIGDTVVSPSRPLQMQRAMAANGARMLQVPFGRDGHVHDLVDPVIGDRISAVTGLDPVRGLAKPQSLTEVQVLPSVQGLAFVPNMDDVSTSISEDFVVVTRPGGLKLSGGVARVGAAVPLSQRLGAERNGALDIGSFETRTPAEFNSRRAMLFGRVIGTRSPDARMAAWYDLARLYIARQLGAEAEGALGIIGAQDAGEVETARFLTLMGAAEVLMGRYDSGMAMLSKDQVAETPDAAFWRVIGAVGKRDYIEARKAYPVADRVAGTYPHDLQARMLLDAARASIELNDFGQASTLLAQVDVSSLPRSQYALIDLLGSRIADASGRSGDAVEFLNHAVMTGRGAVAAEANFRLVQLQQREGLITREQAIKRLEGLEVAWRGDAIELMTLKALAELSVEQGDFRRAFEATRVASEISPKSDITRGMQDEMGAAFASLFLDGAADKMRPIEALALYYDFKDLTPNGHRGDAMVRKLANRLVDVDLLQQAAELLQHQVDSRLRGAARAQVAADLALIYLVDNHPDRALMTLSRTRQAQLPANIDRQRRVVESRALSETGKTDMAVELLTPLRGLDIQRLRADILWQGKRYHDAGEQIERLLGGRWGDQGPLSDSEQLDVLKAAIAFSLSNDEFGRERMRTRFLTKMSGTKNAAAFDVVTGPFATSGYEFRSVADMIKATDSIGQFLAAYRKQYVDPEVQNTAPVVKDAPAADKPAPTGPAAEGAKPAEGAAPAAEGAKPAEGAAPAAEWAKPAAENAAPVSGAKRAARG